MKATVFLVTLLAFSAQAAFASGHTGNSSDPLDTRIYKNGLWFGAGVNWTDVDPDGGDDDNAFGGNVRVGWQFLNYFGVNAAYKNLGGYDFGGPGGVGDNADVYGFTVGANAGYPITQRVGIIGGIGYFDFDIDGIGGDSDENGLYVSGGVATQIGRIIIQPELVWYDADDADVYGFELNFFWKTEIGNN
jgi:hypothetical protein